MSMNGEYINKMVDSMREATTEERQGISNYIDSISVDTGFKLWDLQEQVKIYDAYYNKGYKKGKKDTIDRLRDMFDYDLFKLYSNDDRFISFNNLSLMIRDMLNS